jgi:hypothetical protein
MLTKSKIMEAIENLPEEVSIDDIIDRLILIEKTEKGIRQSDNGEVLSDAELDKEMEKWFK